ncbi:LAGLIDADG family homing endonuclease [Candidatus Curtissbacteria bacterium]|nr:LAGLIDADG family homing endonuclease [Candidatus Curtissbacteria bacterium]
MQAISREGPAPSGAGNPQRLYAEYPKLKSMDPNEATLLGILYTDGCLSPKGKNGWRFYLGNTSWQIIKVFKDSLTSLFNLPEYRVRISEKIVNGKPFYKAVVDSKEIGQILTNKYGTFRTLRYSSKINGQLYPPASLPYELQNPTIICHFLKVAFSCDGGINLYVARNKYTWLIRNVYLACKHPVLIKQYKNLLKKIGIESKILWQDDLIRIQCKKNLEIFAKKVGFMEGVKITQHSAYWQGIEKQKVLQFAIASYGNPKAIYNLPQFRVKI